MTERFAPKQEEIAAMVRLAKERRSSTVTIEISRDLAKAIIELAKIIEKNI